MSERVGDAYVRIHAEGDGLDAEIRKMMQNQDGTFDDKGRDHFRRYRDAFERESLKKNNQKALSDSVTRALAKADWSKTMLDSPSWRQFRDDLHTRFGDIGDEAGRELEDGIVRGMDAKTLRNKLNNLTVELSRAQKKLANDAIREAKRQQVAENQLVRDAFRKAKAIEADIASLGSGDGKSTRKRHELLSDIATLSHSLEGLGPAGAHATEDLARGLVKSREELKRLHPHLTSMEKGIEGVGNAVGKMFGLGSRNNFFNAIGGLAKGLVTWTKIFPAAGKAVLGLGHDMATAFAKGKDLGGPLVGIAFSIGQAFSSIGGAVSAGVLAFGGLLGITAPLVAGLSLIAGWVVAVAASLSFAAVGAIGALTAVALPAAAALGVLAFSLGGMSAKAKKALALKFKPVTNEINGLREATRSGLFGNIGQDAKILAPTISGLKPLFHDTAAAVHQAFAQMVKGTNSSGFRDFRDQMQRYLPHAVREFGEITKNTFGGIGGVLKAMIPSMNNVLEGLDTAAQKFSKWANSVKGQNQIKKFFDEGATSLQAFLKFGGAVGRLLATLISQGRTTGDSIFGSMTKNINAFTDHLQKNPDILKNWFNSAKKFGDQVGNVVVGIGKLIGALDGAASRKAITVVFSALAKSVTAIANVLSKLSPTGATILFGVAAAVFALSTAFKAVLAGRAIVGVISTVTTGLAGMGGAGAAAAGGMEVAGASAATMGGEMGAAAAGASGLASSLGLIAGVALGGALFTKWVVSLDAVKHSSNDAKRAIGDLARTGNTHAFDNVSKVYGAALPIINKLSGGFLHLGQNSKNLGTTLRQAAFTDLPKIFAPGALAAVKQLDTQLASSNPRQAAKAFAAITKQGEAAGLTLKDITKLFPQYTKAHNAFMTSESQRLTEQQHNWILLGKQMNALPKSLRTTIATPGLIKSVADVKALVGQYKLTPKQLVTVLAATGVAETIKGVANVRKQFHLTPKQVTTLLTMTGQIKTRKDLDAYTRALHLTPKQVQTIMRVLGIKPARQSFAAITAQLKGLPRNVLLKLQAQGYKPTADSLRNLILSSKNLSGKQIKMIIKATGADISKKQMHELMNLADSLNRKHPKPRIDLNNNGFLRTFRPTMHDLDTLNKKKATTHVTLNNHPFLSAFNTTLRNIGILNKKHPTPKADLNPAPFHGKYSAVIGNIVTLGKKHPTPTASLKDNASSPLHRVGGLADSVGRKHPTPKVTAVVGQALGALSSVQGRLAGIHGKSIGIHVTTYYTNRGNPSLNKPRGLQGAATGGIFEGVRGIGVPRMIGEAGAEAVVPLNRPLSQVDPAVRMLSAIAQNKMMASGGVVGTGRTIDVGGITVVTPNSDSRAVATEVVNRLVASSY